MKKKNIATLLIFSSAMVVSSIASSSFVFNNTIKNTFKSENNIGQEPVARIVGHDESYTSIEKALDVAVSGDIVYVIPPLKANYNDQTNPNNPDKVTYRISKNCEIKQGVTLFIPTDQNSVNSVYDSKSMDYYINYLKTSKRDQGSDGYNLKANQNSTRYLRISIELEENITLTNNGRIVVSGFLGGGTSNSGMIGQTSHSYSQLIMKKGSKIMQNDASASLYCFGYILEESKNNGSQLLLNEGKLYLPTVISDYRGFSYSYAMTLEAIDDYRCSPFNQFEFINVGVETEIKYNSSVIGLVNVYVKYDNLEVNETISQEIALIGNGSSNLLQMNNEANSSVNFKYNSFEDLIYLDLIGGVKLNPFVITLTLKGQNLDLSTANAFLPISYKYNITLKNNEKQTNAYFDLTEQRVKLLPGSNFVVDSNVQVNGSEFIVYSSFYDGSVGAAQGLITNIGRGIYPLKKGANFYVHEGSILNFASFGGYIYSDETNFINTSNDSVVSNEPWNYGSPGSITVPWNIKDYLQIKEKLNIVPLSYNNKKKIYCGLNKFYSLVSYSPTIKVTVNSEDVLDVKDFQSIIFDDDINTFTIEPISDVYRIYNQSSFYQRNTILSGKDENLIGVTSSNISISSDLNGINEFDVQSIKITGDSNEMYVDTVKKLNVEILDINKSYVKDYTWRSTDESILTVDQEGYVTAKSIGIAKVEVVCDGVVGEYVINVIEPEEEFTPIESVTIVSDDNKNSGDKFKDGQYGFSVQLNPTDADIESISWTINNVSGVIPDRQGYYYNGERVAKVDGATNVVVELEGGLNANTDIGATADEIQLVCTIVDKYGNKVSSTFNVVNDSGTGACLLPFSKVMLANGQNKLAKDLKKGDKLLTYNHFKGCFEEKDILVNIVFPGRFPIIKLVFESEIVLTVATGHGLFNLNKNRYEIYYGKEFIEHIGEYFAVVKIVKGKPKIISAKLMEVSIKEEETIKYSPVSEDNINCISDNVLTIPDDIEGMFDCFNFSGLSENLKIDIKDFACKINQYGVYDYEEVEKVIPKYLFEKLNFKFFKTFIKAGVLSEEKVNYWIDKYAQDMCIFNDVERDFDNRMRLKKGEDK